MRKIILILLTLIIVVSISACGNNSTSSNDYLSSWEPDNTAGSNPTSEAKNFITKENISYAEDGLYKMREENNETRFSKVSDPSWFEAYGEKVDSGDSWHPYYIYTVHTDNYPDFSFETVQQGKDQLITIGHTVITCRAVIEMDYTIPYYLAAYSGTIHYMHSIGSMIGSTNEDIEEINGQDPSAYLNRLSKYYNVLRAQKGEEFTFGRYSGTDFIEETFTANDYYYIVGDSTTEISLPTTATREGYFLVDYSALEPGFYVFGFGTDLTGDHFIVEVK